MFVADVPTLSQRLTFSGVVGKRSKPTVENEREVESKLNRRNIRASDALPAMSPDPPEVASATRISLSWVPGEDVLGGPKLGCLRAAEPVPTGGIGSALPFRFPPPAFQPVCTWAEERFS